MCIVCMEKVYMYALNIHECVNDYFTEAIRLPNSY